MNNFLVWKVDINNTINDEIFIIFDKNVFDQINCYRQEKKVQKEACGVVIGERKNRHFFIKKFTTPMLSDNRGRYFCKRNNVGHQEIVDQLHLSSHGCLQYLGEWHSHPEKEANPSKKDLTEWLITHKYLCDDQQINEMVCLILGTKKDWLGLYYFNKLYTAYFIGEYQKA